MRCKTFLSGLPAWLDGEAPTARVADLEAHAAGCPTCAAELGRERRLVAMLDGGLVDRPLPTRLRDRIHRAVDALAIVEARPMGPDQLAARRPDAVPLYAHPVAIQWLSMSAVLAITLTAGLAAGRTLAPPTGTPPATAGTPIAAVDPGTPPATANTVPPVVAGADGRQVVAISEPVAEQLARHLDTTERLYQKVVHATPTDPADERRTRAIVNAELYLSQIRRVTPALRVALGGDSRLAEPARGYFDQAENLYARIEAWSGSPNVELAAVRAQLERLPLPRQIEQLRVALGPGPRHAHRVLGPDAAKLLPAEVVRELALVPGSGIYVQFLQDYHRGRTHEAMGRLQQLRAVIERSPQSPLAEDFEFWVERVAPDEEAMCEIEVIAADGRRDVVMQPFAVAQFDTLTRSPEALTIDGRRHGLRAPAEAAQAFVGVWKAAEARQLELGRAGEAGGLVVTDAETQQTTTGADAKAAPATIALRQVALEIPTGLWAKDLEAAYAALCQRADVPPPLRSARPRILQLTVTAKDLPRDR